MDQNNWVGLSGSGNEVNITNFGGMTNNAASGIYCIYQNGKNFITNCNIDNMANGGVPHNGLQLSGIETINNTNGYNRITNNKINIRMGKFTGLTSGIRLGAQFAIVTADNNKIRLAYDYSALSGSPLYGIYLNISNVLRDTISNNTINNVQLGTSGGFTGIFATSSASINYIANNTIDTVNFVHPTGTGTVYGIYNLGSPAAGSKEFILNNTIGRMNCPSTRQLAGIYSFTATGCDRYLKNNTVSKLKSAGLVYGIFAQTGDTSEIFNNSITNDTSINNIVYGLFLSSTNNLVHVKNNTIQNHVTLKGTSTTASAFGIYNNNGTGRFKIEANKISDIVSLPVSALPYGLFSSNGNFLLYNNYIGDIKAPNTGNTVLNPVTYNVIGVGFTSTLTTISNQLYNNTIYLNTSGTGQYFSSAALSHTRNPILDIRNNIIINKSTPGTSGKTVAYARTTRYRGSHNTLSNNNLFYAGTPGTSNLLYRDSASSAQNICDMIDTLGGGGDLQKYYRKSCISKHNKFRCNISSPQQ